MPGSSFNDTFGRRHTYLRLSLTERCNLRCRYCMPAEGVALTPAGHLLTDDEVVRLARVFVRGGVTKIRLTGGEPLLRPGVATLAGRLAALPGLRTLALTTNGLLLPKLLPSLHAAGLSDLTISLDTLRPDRFRDLARRDGLALVRHALDAAQAHGFAPLKLNCVVLRGVNDDELADFAALTEDRDLDVRFIEYMPFAGNGWQDAQLVPMAEMIGRIEARVGALERLADAPHATAQTYRVPGFQGRLGFIASMSTPFCATCNRLRLTADGALKVCLFGRAEASLRDALRAGASDDEVHTLINGALRRKHAAHAGNDHLKAAPNRPMILIGG